VPAKYVSPPKRIVTRKRKANPDKWQKNIRKRLRQAGSEYTDTKGKTVEAREMKDIDCDFPSTANLYLLVTSLVLFSPPFALLSP
jgi:hypothetical protein